MKKEADTPIMERGRRTITKKLSIEALIHLQILFTHQGGQNASFKTKVKCISSSGA